MGRRHGRAHRRRDRSRRRDRVVTEQRRGARSLAVRGLVPRPRPLAPGPERRRACPRGLGRRHGPARHDVRLGRRARRRHRSGSEAARRGPRHRHPRVGRAAGHPPRQAGGPSTPTSRSSGCPVAHGSPSRGCPSCGCASSSSTTSTSTRASASTGWRPTSSRCSSRTQSTGCGPTRTRRRCVWCATEGDGHVIGGGNTVVSGSRAGLLLWIARGTHRRRCHRRSGAGPSPRRLR